MCKARNDYNNNNNNNNSNFNDSCNTYIVNNGNRSEWSQEDHIAGVRFLYKNN